MADPPSLKLWRDKERGIRREGEARSEREHRRPMGREAQGNPQKITLSAPAGSNKVKMKNLKGKFTCNLEIYNFYGDF